MKAVPFTDIAREEWDSLVSDSRQGWLFHRHDWIVLETRQGAENRSFGLFAGARLVAIAPLYISRVGLGPFVEILVHDGYHRHTGLAAATDLDSSSLAAIRSAWLKRIEEIAREADADRIHLARQNLAPHSLGAEREEIPHFVMDDGFQLGHNFGPGGIVPAPGLATVVADQIVVLDADEETLFSRLKDTCRRAVRKAEKSGVGFQDVSGTDDPVATYYALAKRSAERTGEQLAPVAYYRTIFDHFQPAGNCSVLAVEIDGAPAAATILLHDKQSVLFLSGVSDPVFLDRRINDYLHWSAIRWARQRGFAHYRLGPYFPAVPKGWPIEMVSRFKTKLGGQPRTIVQASRFLKPKRYAEMARAHISRLCEELHA